MLIYIFIIILNAAFFICLWHLDINHNLDRMGKRKTRGIIRTSPETAYRISQYGLIVSVIIFDILLIFLLLA